MIEMPERTWRRVSVCLSNSALQDEGGEDTGGNRDTANTGIVQLSVLFVLLNTQHLNRLCGWKWKCVFF